MITFRTLSEKFLAWSMLHQATNSTVWYRGYIQKFLAFQKEDMPASDMKPYHIETWIDSHHEDWGANYKRGAVVALNRVYNWAIKSGYLENNPIKTAHKPPPERRKTYAKVTDFDSILHSINPADSFRDWVEFLWLTGCRPKEARDIQHRHVHLDGGYILFPKEEAKGKRRDRRILLNDRALEIVKKNMEKNPDGHVFRNSDGTPWSKYAICNRFSRLQEKLGNKITSYDFRHGFGTRKLKEGKGHLEIAEVMGHVDGSMLARVYSHIDDDVDHLRAVLD